MSESSTPATGQAQMSVKAFLYAQSMRVGEGEAEVRRFPVDESAATNFDYLTEKVRQYFPQLKRKSFKLYWKDSEGDFISFSSDDELVEILTQMTASRGDPMQDHPSQLLLRIFILPSEREDEMPPPPPYSAATAGSSAAGAGCAAGSANGNPAAFQSVVDMIGQIFPQVHVDVLNAGAAAGCSDGKQQQQQQQQHQPGQDEEDRRHPGIVCDGCESSVVGVRYKCMTCADYDLCSACFGKNIHSEHVMVVISEPMRRFPMMFGQRMRCGERRGHPYSHHGGEHGGPSGHKHGHGGHKHGGHKHGHEREHGHKHGHRHGHKHGPGREGGYNWFQNGAQGEHLQMQMQHLFNNLGSCLANPAAHAAASAAASQAAAAAAQAAANAAFGFPPSQAQNEDSDFTMGDGMSSEEETGEKTPAADTAQTNDTAAAGTEEASAKGSGSATKGAGDAPNGTGSAPNSAGSAPNSAGRAQNGAGSASNGAQNGTGNAGEEYLKFVGQSVAAILDPFGIDVVIDVETPLGRKMVVESFKKRKGEKEEDKKEGKGEGEKKDESEEASATNFMETDAEVVKVTKKVAEMTTKDKETGQEATTEDAGATTSDADATPGATAAEPAEASAPPPVIPIVELSDDDEMIGSKGGDEDWQLIGASASAGTTAAAPASIARTATDGEVAGAGAIPKSKSPSPEREAPKQSIPSHVAKSLEQMMSMGFSNDGKWLEQLLLAKDGNISMALDAINPSKPASGHGHH